MSSPQQLVDEWRDRLAGCQSQVADSSRSVQQVNGWRRPILTWSWVRRIYARVLAFLITRYETSDVNVPPLPPKSRMPFVDVSSPGPGKPPRSGETIRSTLDSVHAANAPGVAEGTLIHGLTPDQPIIAGLFYERSIAKSFRGVL